MNLYDAATVQLVLTRYPRLHSIKDLGTLWRSPWKLPFVKVFGATYALDDIELEDKTRVIFLASHIRREAVRGDALELGVRLVGASRVGHDRLIRPTWWTWIHHVEHSRPATAA